VRLWKKPLAKPDPKSASSAPYYLGTVTTSDVARARTVTAYNADAAHMLNTLAGYAAICVNRNAEAVGSVRMRLYRPAKSPGSRNGTRTVDRKTIAFLRGDATGQPSVKSMEYASDAGNMEEVVNDPVLDLYRQPNAYQSCTAFRTLHHCFKEAAGDSYVNIVGAPGEVPEALHLLYPQWTRVVPSREGLIESYLYGRDSNQAQRFRPEDIWHDNFNGAPVDGSAWIDSNSSRRVRKGGSWSNEARMCRSACREWHWQSDRYND
jgi:phage portal protein BeeE